MIEFDEVVLEKMVIHQVGNPSLEEDLILSNTTFEPQDEVLIDLLKTYFFKPFQNAPYFNFFHESDLAENPVFHAASFYFNEPESLYMQSVDLAKFLFEQSTHPNIKSGELYVVAFDNFKLDDEYVNGLGIFKSENKETFLTIHENTNGFDVDKKDGINIKKLDKGCLVFNTEKEQGYRVCMVDVASRSADVAHYWKHDFLNVRDREDSYYHTNTVLDMCKNFCEDVFTPENDVAKPDQMLLMDRSINYFQKNDEYNAKEFEHEVIKDPGVIDAFNDYKENFVQQNDVPVFDEFAIAPNAVKGQKRFFKSVLKLDKRFHVYVHGGHDFMEQGFDEERGMRYYKLFYNKEA